jgi:5'-nucleotidase
MNILITNDDGIESPGLLALAEAMARVGSVTVVAPAREQSSAGTCVSLRGNPDVQERQSTVDGVRMYAVEGTPSDCVILAIYKLYRPAKSRVDLLLSGVNFGPNVGRDIPYSGTVMATLPGYYRAIPSLAVSLFIEDWEKNHDFGPAAGFSETLARQIGAGELRPSAVLNVNVPDLPRDEIRGVRITRTVDSGYIRVPYLRQPSSEPEPSSRESRPSPTYPEDTDLWALQHGYVSITPLHFDLTRYDCMSDLEEHVVSALSLRNPFTSTS